MKMLQYTTIHNVVLDAFCSFSQYKFVFLGLRSIRQLLESTKHMIETLILIID